MIIDSNVNVPDVAVVFASGVPSITIDATSKFAPIITRLFADMTMNLSRAEDGDVQFLELCKLSGDMEVWRNENPSKCVS